MEPRPANWPIGPRLGQLRDTPSDNLNLGMHIEICASPTKKGDAQRRKQTHTTAQQRGTQRETGTKNHTARHNPKETKHKHRK